MNKLPLVVDAHTHLFNARYLPLTGILASWGVPRHLAWLTTRLVNSLTGKSKLRYQLKNFSLKHHDDAFDEIINEIGEITIQQIDAQLTEVIESDYFKDPSLLHEPTGEFIDSELYEVLIDIHDEFGDADSARELDLGYIESIQPADALSSKGIKFLGFFKGVKRMVKRLLKKAFAFIENAADYLDFIHNMMRSEKGLLDRLTDYYDAMADEYLMIHYMMDMRYPFNDKPKYDFYKRQLPRMSALEKHSKGKSIGFSAFDIKRFSRGEVDPEAIYSHLERALAHGKLGFKFYPPMGFRAAGNENPKEEQVADIFFDYCVENRVPVFCHCTPEGFEQGKNTGLNSDPDYWEQCLKKPNRESLILCFGHAGGGKRQVGGRTVDGWLSTTDNNWDDPDNYARKVVKLCRTYEHVYCDLSYMHEIIHDDHAADALKQRLITELGREIDQDFPYALSDKMMYGSDWHMVSVVNDIDTYFAKILEIFSSDELTHLQPKFFAQNAITYLDLASFIPKAREKFGDIYADRIEQIIAIADNLN